MIAMYAMLHSGHSSVRAPLVLATLVTKLTMFRYLKILNRSSCILQHLARSLVYQTRPLYDRHDRIHNYLRISITDRCNLRCRYCMPEGGVELTDRGNYLTLDELKRLADVFVLKCGVTKIRLTGGEPTIDKKCLPLVGYLNGLKKQGLEEIAMTTNGLSLKRQASLMRRQGLDSINISLDTLREERFEISTRRRGWKLTFEGLRSALDAGFDQVKVNCVVMRGFNEDEIENYIRLATEYPIEVRFIEFMPFLGNSWNKTLYVPSRELLASAIKIEPQLVPVPQSEHATSKVYSCSSMRGSIGFISSMSDNFCSGCNRLRLTSDGYLKVCLFGKEETSLRDLIRNGAKDEEIVRSIVSSLGRKSLKHAGANVLMRDSTRPMVKIARRLCHSSSSNTGDASARGFSHLDDNGNVAMVDVGSKPKVRRVAVARGRIVVGRIVLDRIKENKIAKGGVIGVSKLAGVMGAKVTSQLIPLCHNVPLDHVLIEIEQCNLSDSLVVTASVQAHYNTGVEMESLTAVSVTLLAIYDMCKSISKSMIISDIELLSKYKHE